MPQQRTLKMTSDERAILSDWRDRAEKPYLRERASALLQIEAGKSGAEVARDGLLKPRQPDTIYEWLDRFEDEGPDGLYIRDGRGRKAAYEP